MGMSPATAERKIKNRSLSAQSNPNALTSRLIEDRPEKVFGEMRGKAKNSLTRMIILRWGIRLYRCWTPKRERGEVRKVLASHRWGCVMIAWHYQCALDGTGIGARTYGGRWNAPGMHGIYARMTPEISAMEKLVHAGDILPVDLVLVDRELPEDTDLYYRCFLG